MRRRLAVARRRPLRSKCLLSFSPRGSLSRSFSALYAALSSPLTTSNDYMKVQLAKIKAENEKSGTKNDHKVCPLSFTDYYQKLTYKSNFKKVAETWKTAYVPSFQVID
jgi:hypothetical protein